MIEIKEDVDETLKKRVRSQGNSGAIFVPHRLQGCDVIVLVLKEKGEKMDMKKWNFLERAAGIKNRALYIENKEYTEDVDQKWVSIEYNVEDTDSETIDASYREWVTSEEELEEQIEEMKKEFKDCEIIENY